MSQVDSLRSRVIFASVMSKKKSIYYKIGSSAREIAKRFKNPAENAKDLVESCLSDKDANKACDYSTTLSTPLPDNFEPILRHGYENAKCVPVFGEMSA